ncbi:MAG: PqiC family protein [Nitrospinales bacterium]
MLYPLSRLTIIAMAAIVFMLTGCVSSAPSRFYVLTSFAPLENKVPNKLANQEFAIEIGPIEFPQYLDHLPILNRVNRNEFQLSEFDLWAEPLEDNFSRVLVENLSILIPSNRVVLYPSKRREDVGYQIEVNVIQFDGAMGGDCSLSARWAILEKNGKKKLLIKKSSFTERSADPSYAAMVGALNKTLTELSREIASALKGLNNS